MNFQQNKNQNLHNVDAFSGVSYEDTLEAANDIRKFAKKHNLNYGSDVSSEMKYRFE